MTVVKNMTTSCLAVLAAREAAGLSRRELAAAIEVSPRKVQGIELGYQQPSVEVFARVAAACWTTMDDMLAQDHPGLVQASEVVPGLVDREGAATVLGVVAEAIRDS